MRKKISTLFVLSAAIALLLLLSSPLLLSNPLLQPAQAQTPMNFQTLIPAISQNGSYALIFDADGTLSSDNQSADITTGDVTTFYTADGPVCSGTIYSGQFTKNNMALVMDGAVGSEDHCGSLSIKLKTSCSNSPRNVISVTTDDVNVGLGTFSGPVDCSIEGGGAAMTTGTTEGGAAADTGTPSDTLGNAATTSSTTTTPSDTGAATDTGTTSDTTTTLPASPLMQ